MSRPEKPKTQKETIDQMWFVLIGANSEGIAERVRSIDNRLRDVEQKIPEFMTHDEHQAHVESQKKEYREDKAEEKSDTIENRRREWRRTDVVLAVLMIMVTATSVLGVFI